MQQPGRGQAAPLLTAQPIRRMVGAALACAPLASSEDRWVGVGTRFIASQAVGRQASIPPPMGRDKSGPYALALK